MLLRRAFGGTTIAAGLILACSGGSSVSSSACQHLYNALQSFSQKCGGSDFFFAAQSDRAAKSCAEQLSAPGSATTNADVDACASALEKLQCNSSKTLEALSSCTKPGTVANGGPCSTGLQCQSGQCSVTTSEMCGMCIATAKEGEACDTMKRCASILVCTGMPSTCVKPVYNPAGAPCDSGAQRCDDGLRCDFTAKKCIALVTSGGACMNTSECASPLVCSAQKCIDPPGEGGDCSMTFRCAAGLVCDGTTTRTCTKRTYVKPGQPCTGLSSVCESTLSCPQSKICPMVIPDGSPCTVGDMNNVCDYAARCVDGKCGFGVPVCK